MPRPVAELELSVRRSRDSGYDAELRFTGPEDDADTRSSGSTLSETSLAGLRSLDPMSDEYGIRLFSSVFENQSVLTRFREALAVIENDDADVRFRLILDPTAPELHLLAWEALRDPDAGGALLFTGERIFFSRYVSTTVYRSLRRRPKGALRALGVIVNPTDLNQYAPNGDAPLAPVDVEGESARIKEALRDLIAIDVLRTEGSSRVGIEEITQRLRERPYDILYLVCHGALDGTVPNLYLEGRDGTVEVVEGTELVRRIFELRNRPSLVVLASCQSAGTGDAFQTSDGGAIAALGPRLAADAGVPAVIAMQGNVTMETVRQFMPVFFSVLAKDGQLDRAVATARSATRNRPDAWVPILFMRLKGGAIWYEQGFEEREGAFERWEALTESITAATCTPILGPGLVEPYVGTRRELARALAKAYDYPLASYQREDLPAVAQYVAVEQSKALTDRRIVSFMCEEVQSRYGDVLTDEARTVTPRNLNAEKQRSWHDELMRQAWSYRLKSDPPEAHEVLAALPLPVYLNANFDNLLPEALRKTGGKSPVVEICRWNDALSEVESVFDQEPKRRFDEGAPLVYHLFGKVDVPDSLVTTQDDYFDALIATSSRQLLPPVVKTALTNSALLFIGFQIDDWNFRVLFRFLMNQEGAQALRRHPHVAVQIDPEDQRFHNPRAARRYLAKYFGEAAARISIYWGSAEDFTRELQQQCQARGIIPSATQVIP